MRYVLCAVFLLLAACGDSDSAGEECSFRFQCTDDTICVAQGSGCSKDIETADACANHAKKISDEKKATLLSSDFSVGACSK